MDVPKKKLIFENQSTSINYVEIKRIGHGSYSTVIHVEERTSKKE